VPAPFLLAQKGFCDVARFLEMLYTVMITNNQGVEDIQIIQTKTHNLVSINQEKYILNWSPGTIVNIPSSRVNATTNNNKRRQQSF